MTPKIEEQFRLLDRYANVCSNTHVKDSLLVNLSLLRSYMLEYFGELDTFDERDNDK